MGGGGPLRYSVCGFYASARNFIADWWNRLSRFGRFTKTSSHGVDCFRVYFHVVISLTAFAVTIIYALVHTLPERQNVAFLDESYQHAIKRAPLHLFAVELGLEPAPCPATLPSDQYIVSRCRPTFAGQHAPT